MTRLLGEGPTRVLIILVLLTVVILAVVTLKILLVPLVAASFVSYLLDPGVVVLQRRGMERGTAFMTILGAAAVALIAVLAIMPSWLQLESINANNTSFSQRLEKQLSDVERVFTQRLPMLQSIQLTPQINRVATEYGGRVFEGLSGLITGFTVNLFLVPFIAYFMVRDGRKLRRRLLAMVPNRYFETSLIVLQRIDQQIGGYLRGRLLECILVTLIQTAAMGIARLFVPQPQILLISAVCGATNLIPYVGPLMGASFGILLYLGAYGLPMAAVYGLIIATFAAHLVDNLAIAPLVLSHNVDLHPLTVALVLVIGGELLGILGLLIAIPIAASLKVIVQEIYANYQLQARLNG